MCTQLRQQDLEHTKRIEKLEQLVQTLSGVKAGPSSAAAAAPAAAAKDSDDDDGVDLFGSDDEEEAAEAAKIREQRLADYAAKKSKSNNLLFISIQCITFTPNNFYYYCRTCPYCQIKRYL